MSDLLDVAAEAEENEDVKEQTDNVSKEDIVSNYDKISNSFRGKEYNLPSKNELENNTLKKKS